VEKLRKITEGHEDVRIHTQRKHRGID